MKFGKGDNVKIIGGNGNTLIILKDGYGQWGRTWYRCSDGMDYAEDYLEFFYDKEEE